MWSVALIMNIYFGLKKSSRLDSGLDLALDNGVDSDVSVVSGGAISSPRSS